MQTKTHVQAVQELRRSSASAPHTRKDRKGTRRSRDEQAKALQDA